MSADTYHLRRLACYTIGTDSHFLQTPWTLLCNAIVARFLAGWTEVEYASCPSVKLMHQAAHRFATQFTPGLVRKVALHMQGFMEEIKTAKRLWKALHSCTDRFTVPQTQIS